MNLKLIPACLLASALLMPAIGYTDDHGRDKDGEAMTFIKDSAITAKVKAKLAADDTTSALAINVDTDKDGVVWLSGNVKSKAEADQAESIAKATEGVRSVKNNLKVKAAK